MKIVTGSCLINGLQLREVTITTQNGAVPNASCDYELVNIATVRSEHGDYEQAMTHGNMTVNTGWSPQTLERIQSVIESIEADLSKLHFNDDGTDETHNTTEDHDVHDRIQNTGSEISQF